ncbi:MAG: cytochrome P450 [Anaerolineae bacterium]|nr:cytochrome P450 [Anaerolineae bacterium]
MQYHHISPSLPGPPPLPLVGWRGYLLAFARDPIAFIHKLHRRYGDIAAIACGNTCYIFVFTAAYNRQVLGNDTLFHVVETPFPIPPGSSLARLFTIPGQMNGERNGHQRQVMNKTISRKAYEPYRERLIKLVQRTLDSWQIGEERDLYQDILSLAVRTPGYAMFDIDVWGEGRQLISLIDQWGDALLDFNTRLFPYNLPGASYRRLLQLSELLEAEYRHLITRRRVAGLAGEDALASLIRLHDAHPNRLSDDELIGQINNLCHAGNSSRATIMSWTLFLLSQYPSVLALVQAELAHTLAGHPPTLAQLHDLPWLRNVLKESMRLLPPMNWFSRRVMASAQLGPYAIPADSIVICSPFVTHRQPDVYPDPHRFDPSRWQTVRPDPYEYIPFGAGPRLCPGGDLATMEMIIILAMILQRYQLTPPPQARIDRAGMMLSAPLKMPVQVRPSNGRYPFHPVQGNIWQLIEQQWLQPTLPGS